MTIQLLHTEEYYILSRHFSIEQFLLQRLETMYNRDKHPLKEERKERHIIGIIYMQTEEVLVKRSDGTEK